MPANKKSFVTISNKEVWNELKDFRVENNKKHEEITNLFVLHKADNAKEHSDMKGSINTNRITLGGLVTVIGAFSVWLWSLVMKL